MQAKDKETKQEKKQVFSKQWNSGGSKIKKEECKGGLTSLLS